LLESLPTKGLNPGISNLIDNALDVAPEVVRDEPDAFCSPGRVVGGTRVTNRAQLLLED
jgi:hypothetical protein